MYSIRERRLFHCYPPLGISTTMFRKGHWCPQEKTPRCLTSTSCFSLRLFILSNFSSNPLSPCIFPYSTGSREDQLLHPPRTDLYLSLVYFNLAKSGLYTRMIQDTSMKEVWASDPNLCMHTIFLSQAPDSGYFSTLLTDFTKRLFHWLK